MSAQPLPLEEVISKHFAKALKFCCQRCFHLLPGIFFIVSCWDTQVFINEHEHGKCDTCIDTLIHGIQCNFLIFFFFVKDEHHFWVYIGRYEISYYPQKTWVVRRIFSLDFGIWGEFQTTTRHIVACTQLP